MENKIEIERESGKSLLFSVKGTSKLRERNKVEGFIYW